jgi:mercuric ion transport protein
MENANRKVLGLSLAAMLPALGVSLTWFCCLPLALGALGAGAVALGTTLAPLRPYFTGLAVVFLGLAFYQTYRPRKAECAPGQSCAVQSSRMRQQLILWVITGLTVALLTVGEWSSWVIYWTL